MPRRSSWNCLRSFGSRRNTNDSPHVLGKDETRISTISPLRRMANFIRQVAPVGGEPLLQPIKGSVESLGGDKAPAYGCAGISGRNKFLEVHHQRIAGGNPQLAVGKPRQGFLIDPPIDRVSGD